MTDHKLICFETFLDPHQAEMVRGILETNNIFCTLENTQVNSSMWHLQNAQGGVRVMVLQKDYKAAQNILKEYT